MRGMTVLNGARGTTLECLFKARGFVYGNHLVVGGGEGTRHGTGRGRDDTEGGTLLNTILTPSVWAHSNDPGESCSKQWISNVVPCGKH